MTSCCCSTFQVLSPCNKHRCEQFAVVFSYLLRSVAIDSKELVMAVVVFEKAKIFQIVQHQTKIDFTRTVKSLPSDRPREDTSDSVALRWSVYIFRLPSLLGDRLACFFFTGINSQSLVWQLTSFDTESLWSCRWQSWTTCVWNKNNDCSYDSSIYHHQSPTWSGVNVYVCVVQPFSLFSIIPAGHMSVVKTILQVLLHIESVSLLMFVWCVGDFDPLSEG